MAQFFEIDLAGYSLSEELFSTLPQQTFCVCCLNQDIPFVNISSCTHLSLLETVFKFKMELSNVLICLHCHSMLRKFENFKKQVEKCVQMLNIQVLETKTDPLKLQRTDIKISSYEPQLHDNFDEGHFDDSLDITYKEEQTYVTEVKIEKEFPDWDLNIPLAKMKKKGGEVIKKAKERVKEKPKQKEVAVIDKYEGKINTLALSREALMHEREMQKQDAKYLRLPYKCEDCVISFDFELAWKSHMEKQHDMKKGAHVCDICKSVLSSVPSYKEHIRRHFRRFECVKCGKRYHFEHSAVQHYNDHHGQSEPIVLQLYCDDCDFVTQSHRSYRYHRSKHKQRHECNICHNLFISASNLKLHQYTVHKQSERVFECEPCGKVYKGKSGLLAHMKSSHGTLDLRAYCAACRTYYRSQQSLAGHLRTHSNHITAEDNRFVCNECDAKFVSKFTLRVHIEWEHLGVRRHTCPKCSKTFRQKTTLTKHIQFVHEKKRPPRNKICDYCGHSFTTQAILDSHIRTHTGERPYRCKLCSATFAHASALYNHKKLLHNPNRNK